MRSLTSQNSKHPRYIELDDFPTRCYMNLKDDDITLVLDDPSTIVQPIHLFSSFTYDVERGFFNVTNLGVVV
jgi:hypothetical protein